MDVVVAKYKEDVGWTRFLDKDDIIIYDKSGSAAISGSIVLPNVGREAHTYLWHIVSRYNTLATRTCFLQGDPVDKTIFPVGDGNGWLIRPLSQVTKDRGYEFEPLTEVFTCDLDGAPNQPGLKLGYVFDKFFTTQPPNIIDFPIGAQFIVSNNAIRIRSKRFYQALIEECYTSQLLPWQLERLWPYIFNPAYEVKL